MTWLISEHFVCKGQPTLNYSIHIYNYFTFQTKTSRFFVISDKHFFYKDRYATPKSLIPVYFTNIVLSVDFSLYLAPGLKC